MDGYQYERKCAELLKAKGFSKVEVTPGSGDQGVDVIAYQSGKKYGVQCKYYEGVVGNKAIQEVYAGAAYYNCDIALVITSSTLTKPAKELASKLMVQVWENIDAIYLQKHTAEYIEQQKALRQKEFERQWQLDEQRKQEEQRKREKEQRKRELELKEKANAEKLTKKREENGELDQKRRYIQCAQELLGASTDWFAYAKSDGTVVSYYRRALDGPKLAEATAHFRNIRSVVCTNNGVVGLRHDGSCVSAMPAYIDGNMCNHWSGIIAVAAGNYHIVGLRNDGTCVANKIKEDIFTYNDDGQSNVYEWKNIVQVECGDSFSLGLQSDGHVVFAGKSRGFSAKNIEGWSNIKMIAAGGNAAVGLTREGTVISAGNVSTIGIKPEKGILQLRILFGNTYALYEDGSVGCSEEKSGLNIKERDIISIVNCDNATLGVLDKNGKIYVYSLISGTSFSIPIGIRVFDSYDQAVAEIEMRRDRREQGICQFCGGTFKRFFTVKCSVCGRRKDY